MEAQEIKYVVICQPTERLELYYLSGFSSIGAPRYEYLITEACRYSLSDAKQIAESLLYGRAIVNYTIEPETLGQGELIWMQKR